MIRLDKTRKFRPSSDAKGFLAYLKERAVFGRQIDAYAFAAAYAIKNNADISEVSLKGRSDLEEVGTLDDEVCLALEAGIHAIQKRNGRAQPENSQDVMDLVTKYAEVGLLLLKEKWVGKTGIQIQDDIRKVIG